MIQYLPASRETRGSASKFPWTTRPIGRVRWVSLVFLFMFLSSFIWLWNRPVEIPSFSPGYLPKGYRADGSFVENSQECRRVIQYYRYQDDSGETGWFVLSIERYRFPFWLKHNYPDQPPSAQKISIRGQMGAWVEAAPIGSWINAQGGREVNYVNLLFWEDADFVFSIQSSNLSQNDMLKIARNLAAD